MKMLNRTLAVAGAALLLSLNAGPALAQDQQQPPPPQGGGGGGRGNFDPAQARQRMLDRSREQMDVKDDAEWKAISDRIEKVTQARRELGGGGFGGGFGRGGGPGGPGGGGQGAPGGAGGPGGPGGGRGGFGGTPLPEAEALQKAFEAKAPADEIKSKLAKLRAARKDKEVALEASQEELRKILTARQEAAAVLGGLLK